MTTAARGTRQRYVIVLNHFAQARSVPGGTRHDELFSKLPEWDVGIIAANRNDLSGKRNDVDDPMWKFVWASKSGAGFSRVASWASYSVTALARGLIDRRPDVVYASSPHLLAGLSGLALAKARRAHFIFEVRDLWPQILVDMGQLADNSILYRALRALETLLYTSAEAIVVLAPGVQRHLATRGFSGKLWLIPNGADPEDFVPGASRETLRRRFGLQGFVVAYTGAHGRANGLDLVLDAAADIARERPEVRFLLVGDGPLKQGLMARARREGLSTVSFLNPIPKREMPELLGAVDAGLHVLADVPLFSYGVSPNKLFDYMAAGLPVLTNTPGELSELVTSAGAGVAVSPREIAEGVRRLASADADQRAQWGAAGRRFIASEASRTAMAARLGRLLADVVDDGFTPADACGAAESPVAP